MIPKKRADQGDVARVIFHEEHTRSKGQVGSRLVAGLAELARPHATTGHVVSQSVNTEFSQACPRRVTSREEGHKQRKNED